jgi:Ala-tRNA(Pro) deacylase
MIPIAILKYLQEAKVPYAHRWHSRAVTAQELAAAMHVTGHRVAKSVVVDADGKKWLAVLAASDRVTEPQLAQAIGARRVRMLEEPEFEQLFGDCEVGAEPPFGKLYGLPVIMDQALADEDGIVVRAGSHEEVLEMPTDAFLKLENPLVRPFAYHPYAQPTMPEARA